MLMIYLEKNNFSKEKREKRKHSAKPLLRKKRKHMFHDNLKESIDDEVTTPELQRKTLILQLNVQSLPYM